MARIKLPIELNFGHQAGPIAVTPDGSRLYVAANEPGNPGVDVISTATNAVVDTVKEGGLAPGPLAVTPDDKSVYVCAIGVFVIDTTTNAVVATVGVNGL